MGTIFRSAMDGHVCFREQIAPCFRSRYPVWWRQAMRRRTRLRNRFTKFETGQGCSHVTHLAINISLRQSFFGPTVLSVAHCKEYK